MENHAFDEVSRAMAHGLRRRQVLTRLGAGGLGAALLGAAGRDRARSAPALAQAETCRIKIVATVRLGPSAGALLQGNVPGELRGEIRFALAAGGAIDQGRLTPEDRTEMGAVGQATGRAVNLRVEAGDGQTLVLVGTAEQGLDRCAGAIDGLLTGPQRGDLGDWHASATPLTVGGADPAAPTATAAATTPTATATGTPASEPTAPATPEPNATP